MSSDRRDSFGSRFAFVMAMAGSAIGLGNIWRFPYMVGQYGGAAFIIIYIVCGLLIALPAFLSESIIGRRGRANCYDSLASLAPGTPWKFVGIVAIICCFVISSYYSVVGGWSFDYLLRSLTVGLHAGTQTEATSLFSSAAGTVLEPLVTMTVFLGLTALIVRFGITKGIEKFTKVTTPVLFVVIVLVVTYSVSLPGASGGVEYLLKPDWSKVTGEAVAAALGQSFFSLSLGAGTVLIYSSYMKKNESIPAAGGMTFLFDTMFAVIAGFAVMPAVFAAGLEPASGPSLVFETLPYIFTKMGAVTPVISRTATILFFLAVFLAALSSSVSIYIVCVEHMVDRHGWSRRKGCIFFFVTCWVVGALCALSFGPLSGVKIAGLSIFGLCDRLASNFFMTLVALAFVLFVGWQMPKPDAYSELTNGGTLKTSARLFPVLYFLIKWVVPLMIIFIGISAFVL